MKRNIKIILIDIIYFLLITIILILTRITVSGYITQIQSYGGSLNQINVNENITQTQSLLSSLSSLATRAYLLIFLVVPLVIFILYIIFQHISFKREKFSYKKFILISLAPFLTLILALFSFNIYTLILFIIASYLTFISYFYDTKKFSLAFKKIYKLFPMYLLYLILSLLAIGFFYLTYTRIVIDLEFIPIFIFAVIFSILFSLYKTYLIKNLS